MQKKSKIIEVAANMALTGTEPDRLEMETPPNGKPYINAIYDGDNVIPEDELFLVWRKTDGAEISAPLVRQIGSDVLSLEDAIKKVKYGKNGFFVEIDSKIK